MCADGAHHESIPGETKTVVSFSITFVSTWLMSCGVFPSSSHHIMVHLQEIGTENRDTMAHVMKYRFADWDSVQQQINIQHCSLYNLSDFKALYCITQHTPWNASKSSYLLCKCERGAAARNPEYECVCWTKEEYENLRKKSQEQWDSRDEITQEMREFSEDETVIYDEKLHRDWVKNENNGVSHMGCLPAEYYISNIRFDVFHGTSNVTKSLLRYLRKIMEGNGEQVKSFSLFLSTLPDWGPYKIDPWITGGALCHLKGRHTKVFAEKIELVIQKLNEIFIQLDIHHFIGALRTFYCISCILRLTWIDLFDQVNDVFDLSTVGVTEDSSSNEIAMAVVDEYTSLVKKITIKGM